SYLANTDKALAVLFTELQWAIDDAVEARYDYAYDQIVCIGELLSTTIFVNLLKQQNLNYEWIDARDVIRTDDTYRDAHVDWEYSEKQAKEKIGRKIAQGKNVIT